MELPGGKKAAALSDGMGAGETACKESTLVIELLEELLAAGFPGKSRRSDDQYNAGDRAGGDSLFDCGSQCV